MRLVQFWARDGRRAVASLSDDGHGRVIQGVVSTYELASRAIAQKSSLKALVERLGFLEEVDIRAALAEGRVLPPLDHPDDPAHLVVTGTGLTHLGSAQGRDSMHKDLSDAAKLTDSMKMFK